MGRKGKLMGATFALLFFLPFDFVSLIHFFFFNEEQSCIQ